MAKYNISEVTRRAIIDFLAVSDVAWSGRLREDEFLARLYDIASMPSHDYRLKDAKGDIIQHRISFGDWEDDWVFYDNRFNLLHGSSEGFLRFLCETVHPIVRPDTDESLRIVAEYNKFLSADDCAIVEIKRISERSVFGPAKSGQRTQVFEEPTGWEKVDRQINAAKEQLRTSETEEDFQAVGLLCRETLITVAQEVYVQERHHTRDGKIPSDTDAARMLEGFFDWELSGGTNEEARACCKATLRLALALQHKRNADFRMAALCVEATVSVVNFVALLSDRRKLPF